MKYDFKAVEAKWQKVWQDEHTFHAEIDHSKPKFYALVEFPYPSAADLCGHGIGTHLHEAPEIPNFRMNRKGMLLKAGMTLAIEPMITAGGHEVDWLDDDWTVVTRDGSLSAHYENTILITEGEPRILSLTCDNE